MTVRRIQLFRRTQISRDLLKRMVKLPSRILRVDGLVQVWNTIEKSMQFYTYSESVDFPRNGF